MASHLELAVHDVSGLLHFALDTMADVSADKTIDIEYVEPADPMYVNADAGRLQQVFANVLSNAVKFTHPHGHIRLRIDREGESAVVESATAPKCRYESTRIKKGR